MPRPDKLTAAITVKFSAQEAADLEARAQAAGLPLRTYIRRCAVGCNGVSGETALVLAEVGRIRELLMRLWRWSGDPEMLTGMAAQVEAIESRVLVARTLGGK